ncbi:hypothetical protein SAMN02927921_02647 [Sinomicrobium oceani]|uniref:Uncharacterized protein n=1 Tax=Sinomicrobium oceani TaxID=1150368 RepID=A0A1K1QMZ4_9FLAO|nr:hypothetical protein SAMN02927921_02647 [Sinomicrobium oceani]
MFVNSCRRPIHYNAEIAFPYTEVYTIDEYPLCFDQLKKRTNTPVEN